MKKLNRKELRKILVLEAKNLKKQQVLKEANTTMIMRKVQPAIDAQTQKLMLEIENIKAMLSRILTQLGKRQ